MTFKKTNAARFLDELGISYQLRGVDVDDLEDLSGVAMAKALGASADEVFKTLVALGDKNGVLLACIPSEAELDLKALAIASGNKNVTLVPLKEVLPLTGYMRGGCSPIGSKKQYPVYLDENALLLEQFYVSAGQRGLQLYMAPEDLARATQANFVSISRQ